MRCLNCHQKNIPISTEICPRCGVHLPSLMRDILPQNTLLQNGNYRIDYPLGRGGFGITYQAMHTSLEKLVAIKEFYPQEHALRNSGSGELIVPTTKQEIYQRGIEKFLREGQTLAKIQNPHVVGVENYFQERGTAYLVMELITGNTLREELEAQVNRRFSPAQIEQIMSALVGALTEVHLQGIYHLDLKPENVLITSEGRLVLVDFGASRQGLSSSTTSQAFTLSYAPLEVMSGRNFGAASDIFELGMMLHEMLTGVLPPSALDRLAGNTWNPQAFAEPWQTLLTSALKLHQKERSQNVKSWWESRISVQESTQNQEINTKVCLACGNFNLVTHKYCQNCGTSFNSAIHNKDLSTKVALDNEVNNNNQKATDNITNKISNHNIKTNSEIHPDDWAKSQKGGFWKFFDSLLDDK
ncbi:serine/threonine-protein kinase [Calothrix sp. UHCC 0171]|uniref:serine/threonine protein kinase n=1 Tax=Calothrix sp. UHCC 0171 TaxID=3110245 RepID=UPI002B1F7383|nr:serine/threonine-protein kinase [Calothrix sp. UHCC 0171]MEA5570566.1 serine/threonine-protein kinase [Calothrix sp. UHCC 0171]